MPQPESDFAIKWKPQAPYLGISDIDKETAFLTEYNLPRYIESSRYQICLDMIATEIGHGSCFTIRQG